MSSAFFTTGGSSDAEPRICQKRWTFRGAAARALPRPAARNRFAVAKATSKESFAPSQRQALGLD